jgi:hypothetical protein
LRDFQVARALPFECYLPAALTTRHSLLWPQAIDPDSNVAFAPPETAKADLAGLWHAIELQSTIDGGAAFEACEIHHLLHR